MARLEVTLRAARDSAAIYAMLADNAGAEVAARYRREIDALYDRLVMFPAHDRHSAAMPASASFRLSS